MEITPSGTSPERRTAWIQIRPDILWSLNWVKTVQLNRFLQAKQSTQVQITKCLCIMEITPLGTLLERRKAWIQIRPDILWSLNWVLTVQLNRFLQEQTINSGPDNQKLSINGDYSIGDIIRASNGLDPDQARHFVEPDLVSNRSA